MTEYKVGYRKPPTHSQFKRGNRANPNGRPRKEAKNRERYHNILNTPMTVGQDGKIVEMHATEIGIRRVLNRALEQRKTKDIIFLLDGFKDKGALFSSEKRKKGVLVIKPREKIKKTEVGDNE